MLPSDLLHSDVFLHRLNLFYNLSISHYASDDHFYPVSSLRGRAIALLDIGVQVICIAHALYPILHQTARLVYRLTLQIRGLKTDLSEDPHNLMNPVRNALVALAPRIRIIRADLYGLLVPEWGRTCRVFYSLHMLRKPISLDDSNVAELFLALRAAELQPHAPSIDAVSDDDSLLNSAFKETAALQPHAPSINDLSSVADDDSLLDSAFEELDLRHSHVDRACAEISSQRPATNAAIDDLDNLLRTLDRIQKGLSPTERTKWDSLLNKISEAAAQKQPVTQLFTQCSPWIQKYLFLSIRKDVPTAVQQSADNFVRYVQQIELQYEIWRDVLYVETHKLVPPSEIDHNPQLLVQWVREEAHRASTGVLRRPLNPQAPGYDISGLALSVLAIRQDWQEKELAPWEPLLNILEEGVSKQQDVDSFMIYFSEDLRHRLLEGLSGQFSKRTTFLLSFGRDFVMNQPEAKAWELMRMLTLVPPRLQSQSDIPSSCYESYEAFADWLISKGRSLNL